eukprot:12426168-Karenia_brevis.AAC.1
MSDGRLGGASIAFGNCNSGLSNIPMVTCAHVVVCGPEVGCNQLLISIMQSFSSLLPTRPPWNCAAM